MSIRVAAASSSTSCGTATMVWGTSRTGVSVRVALTARVAR